jgi:hypothetical protein
MNLINQYVYFKSNIMKTKLSKFLSVSAPDFIKGLVVYVLTALTGVVAWGLTQLTSVGVFNFDIIWQSAILAAIGYILKQFLTNSKGELLKSETPKADPPDPPGPGSN